MKYSPTQTFNMPSHSPYEVFEAILNRSPGQHGMRFIDQACKSTRIVDDIFVPAKGQHINIM